MSELKARHVADVYDDYAERPWKEDYSQVYLKSEADKVIAHQKYKRCLAMARWCELEIEQWIEYSDRRQRRKKWLKWWLELAEKFKDSEH